MHGRRGGQPAAPLKAWTCLERELACLVVDLARQLARGGQDERVGDGLASVEPEALGILNLGFTSGIKLAIEIQCPNGTKLQVRHLCKDEAGACQRAASHLLGS
jgi:hypothetical protein